MFTGLWVDNVKPKAWSKSSLGTIWVFEKISNINLKLMIHIR